jgi:hypothetical protein
MDSAAPEVPLYLSSKSYVDLTRQTTNLSRQKQATSKQDMQQTTSNSNYLWGKGSNTYPKLHVQETQRVRSCRM